MKNRNNLRREPSYYVNYCETKKDWNICRENDEYKIDSLLHFSVPFVSMRFQQDHFARNKVFTQSYVGIAATIYLLLIFNINYQNSFIIFLTLIELLIIYILLELNANNLLIRFVYLLPELLLLYTVLLSFANEFLVITAVLNLLNGIVIGKILFNDYRFVIGMWMEKAYSNLRSEVIDQRVCWLDFAFCL